VGDITRDYYRAKKEEQTWLSDRDPIKLIGEWMIAEGHAEADALAQIGKDVEAEMAAAVEFAIATPYPSPDEVGEDVYAD
jgi:pyruvate dehydrogenase E1 component alpha subunit